MIASIRGAVSALGLDTVVIEMGGVGILAHATPATLAALRIGEEAHLASSLVVREDALTLYAFTDDDERAVFETLQTVSGIGPRLALAMLAVHTPEALRRALAAEDTAALMRVPGIGRKGAQRIILELGDKLGPPGGGEEPIAQPTAAGTEEVLAALTQLGWSQKVAQSALDTVVAAGDAADSSDLLRAALQHLGGR